LDDPLASQDAVVLHHHIHLASAGCLCKTAKGVSVKLTSELIGTITFLPVASLRIEECRAYDPDRRSKLLELILSKVNLNEYIRHQTAGPKAMSYLKGT
jgi:hypothetical protein